MLTVVYCITGYKLDFYTKTKTQGKKKPNQYEEEYLDDFAIIEQIIEATGNPDETFEAGGLFWNIISYLETMFKTENGIQDAFPVHSKDPKDGLRLILFLMLQVCIVSNGAEDDLEEDLDHLWKTFNKLMKDKKENVYHALAHHVVNVTVAFQKEPVSL